MANKPHSYRFQELGDVSCLTIAQSIASLLRGRCAVNTSFDSGHIFRPEWRSINGNPVTPIITDALIADWPVSHDKYCDEWWIFESEIPADFEVNSFCNFISTRITDYKELDWPDGCPLDSYLERFRPVAVFGNSKFGYLIDLDGEVV